MKTSEKIILGKRGLAVSIIGLGCMGMNHGYGSTSDKRKVISVIQRAIELGVTFF